jgi:hypothetical protein
MLKKVCLLSLCALVMLAVHFMGSAAGDPPPPNTLGAVAHFDDASPNLITSDGRGDYFDGVQGVKAVFFYLGSQDFVLNTADSTSKTKIRPPRQLNLKYGSAAPAATTCLPNAGPSVPSSQQTAFLNVGGIYNMADGEIRDTTASLLVNEGQLRYGTRTLPSPYCSTRVRVTRSGNTWEVETVPSSETANPTGDVAVLLKDIKGQTVATNYWHMPFHLTITLQ